MTRRRRADTEPTQPVRPLPRGRDVFWAWPLELQREVMAYLDSEQRR